MLRQVFGSLLLSRKVLTQVFEWNWPHFVSFNFQQWEGFSYETYYRFDLVTSWMFLTRGKKTPIFLNAMKKYELEIYKNRSFKLLRLTKQNVVNERKTNSTNFWSLAWRVMTYHTAPYASSLQFFDLIKQLLRVGCVASSALNVLCFM